MASQDPSASRRRLFSRSRSRPALPSIDHPPTTRSVLDNDMDSQHAGLASGSPGSAGPIFTRRLVARRAARLNLRGPGPGPASPLLRRRSSSSSATNATASRTATVTIPILPGGNQASSSIMRNLALIESDAFRPPVPPKPQWMIAAGDRQQLIRFKQMCTDRFAAFRAVDGAYRAWDRDARRHVWERIPIPPKAGPWPGHAPGEVIPQGERYGSAAAVVGQQAGRMRRMARRVRQRFVAARGGLCVGAGAGAGVGRPRLAAAEQQQPWVRRLAARLAADFEPAGLKFKRMLGMGGFGGVFLFEILAEKGVSVPIVVKGARAEPPDNRDFFKTEIRFLAHMNGAAHFLQRIHLSDLPLPAASCRRRIKAARTRIQTTILSSLAHAVTTTFAAAYPLSTGTPIPLPPATTTPPTAGVRGYTAAELTDIRQRRAAIDRDTSSLIVLELMAGGDVSALITKLANAQVALGDRALWLVFRCLFKACVGMASPMRFCVPGMDPWLETMPEQDESVLAAFYDGARAPGAPLVHFDLDPQNALFGKFGEPGSAHEFVPVVKVGDPGCARVVDDAFKAQESNFWSLRGAGKPDHYTPEQFTPEWEHAGAATSLPTLLREPTAGNYNWWTNLYQVGNIMFSLITRCFPPCPPRAWPYTYHSEEDPEATDRAGFTYGAQLLQDDEFAGVDAELRYYVARCLDHRPSERPTMGWLEMVCLVNCVRPDLLMAQSDEALREEMGRVFGEPL